MPEVTDRQRRTRDLLVRKGRDLFLQRGLRGTSVGDLTAAVGIGLGSFYSYFATKEELFFEVLEAEELAIAREMEREIAAQTLTQARVKSLLEAGLERLRGNAVLRVVLEPKLYRQLLRKVSSNRLERHKREEEAWLSRLVTRLVGDGVLTPIEPATLAGVLHALLLLSLHEEELGADTYASVMEMLVALVADHLAVHGDRST